MNNLRSIRNPWYKKTTCVAEWLHIILKPNSYTNGVIHEFEPNRKITHTFEMENSGFPMQLEFLEFEPLSPDRSKLTMHMIFKSVEIRDRLLSMPFAYGLNMAHNRLQELLEHY